MPAPYRAKVSLSARRNFASLGTAVHGQLVKVRCGLCNITRYYRPADLHKLLGDLIAIEIDHRFRCEKCGKSEYMRAEFCSGHGSELQGKTIRELVEIKMVRKLIWRDVKL